jgi:FlaA1/EpsC-like NDP-sugar epimerase
LGHEPEKDIKVEYTGLRPGEKLYEELISKGEGIMPTKHEKIMVLQGDNKTNPEMVEILSRLAKTATVHDARGIKEILQEILPEYTPDMEASAIVRPLHSNVEKLSN